METFLVPLKRKMNSEITENFDDVIKKTKGNGVRSERFKITEMKGDLFSCSESFSLAHCVSRDLKMSKGIAVHFKNKFGGLSELSSQNCRVGETCVLRRGSKFIYYLVTKDRYWHKPTYFNVRASLQHMKAHAAANGVTTVAMPRIGCGLDGLVWERVKDIVTDVFKDTDVRIVVYCV